MAQFPEHTPERPAPALVAEHLLDSLSFSPRIERDLVVAAYHRELTDRACTAPNPESHPLLIEPATLRRLSDERIGKASKSPLNAHLDYTGRLYSDFRFTGAADGPLTIHTLLEVRLRDGTPAVLVAGGLSGFGGSDPGSYIESTGVVAFAGGLTADQACADHPAPSNPK